MIVGERPFQAEDTLQLLGMHRAAPIPRLADRVKAGIELPKGLQELIDKAMAKSPDARYQTAIEFAEAIDEVLARQARSDDDIDVTLPKIKSRRDDRQRVARSALDADERHESTTSALERAALGASRVRCSCACCSSSAAARDGRLPDQARQTAKTTAGEHAVVSRRCADRRRRRSRADERSRRRDVAVTRPLRRRRRWRSMPRGRCRARRRRSATVGSTMLGLPMQRRSTKKRSRSIPAKVEDPDPEAGSAAPRRRRRRRTRPRPTRRSRSASRAPPAPQLARDRPRRGAR